MRFLLLEQLCVKMAVLLMISLLFTICTAGELPEAHLKPFGWGKSSPLEETFQLPSPKHFFQEYAIGNKPLVMRGANKVWPAYENWKSDDYFMSVSPEEEHTVTMEVKRGDPIQPAQFLEWKDFLRSYNESERRMVDSTPSFLQKDVLLPAPLQCDGITNNEIIMGNKMWFGNKYTTSQVHKDAADNINCLVYGVKNYTIVSPEFEEYVLMDKPNGLYSNMDVDKVDLEKYPGLDKAEYLHAELHAGDCIFVPYKWIHQVRSYGRNIAVNVWWNYWKDKELELDGCPTEHDSTWDISKVSFTGWADFENRDSGVQEHVTDLIKMAAKPVTFSDFVGLFLVNNGNPLQRLKFESGKVKKGLKSAYKALDANSDRLVTLEELRALPPDRMQMVIEGSRLVLHELREMAERYNEAAKAAKKYPELMDSQTSFEDIKRILQEADDIKDINGLPEYIQMKVQSYSRRDEL